MMGDVGLLVSHAAHGYGVRRAGDIQLPASSGDWTRALLKIAETHASQLCVGGVFPLTKTYLPLTGRTGQLDRALNWWTARLHRRIFWDNPEEAARLDEQDASTCRCARADMATETKSSIPTGADRTDNPMLLIYASSGCGKSRLAYEVLQHLSASCRGQGTFVAVTFSSGQDPPTGRSTDARTSIVPRILYSWLFGGTIGFRLRYAKFTAEFEANSGVAWPSLKQTIEFIRCIASGKPVFVFVDEADKCPDSVIEQLCGLGCLMDEDNEFAAGFTCLNKETRDKMRTSSRRDLIALNASPLSVTLAKRLLKAVMRPGEEPTRRDALLWAAAGGHARYLELVLDIITQHRDCKDTFPSLLTTAAHSLRSIHLLTDKVACKLVAMSLTPGKKPVDTVIEGTYTVSTAIQDGIVAVNVANYEDAAVYLPAVVLLAMAIKLRRSTDGTVSAVGLSLENMVFCHDGRGAMGGSPFQQLVAWYEVLLNLTATDRGVDDGGETIRSRYGLAGLTRGVHFAADFDTSAKFRWNADSIVTMQHHLANKSQDRIAGQNLITGKSVSIEPSLLDVLQRYLFLPCAGNPGFDMFHVVQRVEPAGPERIAHIVCIETRFAAEDTKGTELSELNVWRPVGNKVATSIRQHAETLPAWDKIRRKWSRTRFTHSVTTIFITLRQLQPPVPGSVVMDRQCVQKLLGSLWYLLDIGN